MQGTNDSVALEMPQGGPERVAADLQAFTQGALAWQPLAPASSLDLAPHRFDLRQGVLQERLAGPTRIYAHDQDAVELVQEREDLLHRRAGVHRQPGPHAQLLGAADRLARIFHRLHVARHDVGSRLGEILEQILRPLHHQMAVQR